VDQGKMSTSSWNINVLGQGIYFITWWNSWILHVVR
jgi:hypothetical protein